MSNNSKIDRWIRDRLDVLIQTIEAEAGPIDRETEEALGREIRRFHQWWLDRHLSQVASHAVLAITNQGEQVPAGISVDDVNAEATISFLDDHGDVAAAPSGADGQPAVIAWSVDNAAVLTIDPVSGKVTPVGVGTANVSATVNDSAGAPINEPDGVTPFAPAPLAVTIVAGAPVIAKTAVGDGVPVVSSAPASVPGSAVHPSGSPDSTAPVAPAAPSSAPLAGQM